jgi:hypothetical protein
VTGQRHGDDPDGILRTVHGAKVDSYLRAAGYGKDDIDMAVAQALTGETSHWLRGHYVTFDGAEYETGPHTVIPADEAAALRPAARPRTVITMPERLRVEGDLAWLLMACETVDRALDELAPAEYRDNPLANKWRRCAGGPVMAAEAVEALNLATGGNPRKGVQGSDTEVCAELADTTFSALLAIQSVTKDVKLTWTIVIEAAAKAYTRVPDALRNQPAPETAEERENTAVLRLMLTMPALSREQATAAVRDAALHARGRAGSAS